MDFERKLGELERITERLNAEDITIDEGIKLFEQSLALARECMQYLTEAKGKVKTLRKELDEVLSEEE